MSRDRNAFCVVDNWSISLYTVPNIYLHCSFLQCHYYLRCMVFVVCRTGETVCLNSDKSYAVSILYHDHLFIVKIMLFKLIQYWGPLTLNVNDCLER